MRMRTEPSRRTGMIQSVSLDSEQHPQDAPDLRQPTRRITRSNQSVALIDIRILVVWLECFEDCDKFPIGRLLSHDVCFNETSDIYKFSVVHYYSGVLL